MAQCESHFIITTKTGDRVPVPCGKCWPCQQRRISGWAFRLDQELKACKSAWFITLTYNNDFVPISEWGELQLSSYDLQCYFKRVRKAMSKKYPDRLLKYYAVGEYGGRTMRPHYHAIVFNADVDLLKSAWFRSDTVLCWRKCLDGFLRNYRRRLPPQPLGYCYFGQVTPQSIGYTVGYIHKSFYSKWNEDVLPPFSLMSKHLGVSYVTPEMYNWHKALVEDRCYVNHNGFKVAMPRYLRSLIYNESETKRIAHFAEYRAYREEDKREEDLELRYGERASEMKLEFKLRNFRKLSQKRQKRIKL